MFLQIGLGLAGVIARSSAAVVHYPPESTNINNLTFVLNGNGAPGIFNSSTTPDGLYGIYNWCNMPHVRTREYKSVFFVSCLQTEFDCRTPSSEYALEYVEVIQRHHKRTPYASNTFFKEDILWDCTGEGPVYYGKRYESHFPTYIDLFNDSASGPASDVTEIQVGATSFFL